MQIQVNFLENLRLEAQFDDFKVLTDQPIRYKGDGSAPSPFDYFLASSALCAAYFVKLYCKSRDIPTEDIKLTQDNIIDPEDRYKQTFHIQIQLPESISEKDRLGILRSAERCSVKKVIQTAPEFKIIPVDVLGKESSSLLEHSDTNQETRLLGKDASLESTLEKMSEVISKLGIKLEVASWRNPVPHVWSVHIRDADSPLCFTNGKGSSKNAALCSALGEYIERLSTNYFYSDYYLGEELTHADFVHYPNEKWFDLTEDGSIPEGLMDQTLLDAYSQDGELRGDHLRDTNSGLVERGICALPYERQSDKKSVYIPVNLIGNLFVSNGMSAGNSLYEARVQALSEIFERAVKNEIISQQLTLPDVPQEVLNKYPHIVEGIKKLEEKGFPVYVKDASLGGRFPVMCVTLMNPKTGGVFASFGAHPLFEVALERSLTELLQGRSFEGLNDISLPTFNEFAICEHNNIIDHFIDSTGVISWRFFSSKSDFDFQEWNFSGSTQEEFDYLMGILNELEKEVYIADYQDLGAHACRILVPNYSEIYRPEDLIWDNNNQALNFRDPILNIHQLESNELNNLVESLEESELDDYMPVSELIGIAFDENSEWGQLIIAELKALIYIALKQYGPAKELTEIITTFSDHLPERKKFYQALDTSLEIWVNDELEMNDYKESLKRMYGEELVQKVLQTISGDLRFTGLTKTNSNLEGIEKHLKMLESYRKLQVARRAYHLKA